MRLTYLIPVLMVGLIASIVFGRPANPVSLALIGAIVLAILMRHFNRRSGAYDNSGDTADSGFWSWGESGHHGHDGGSHGDGGGHGGGDGGGGDGGD